VVVPRYFLHHVLRGNRIEDEDGCEYDDLIAAEWEAVMNIRTIVGHGLLAGGTIPDGHVEIVDESGQVASIIKHTVALRPS
jgi:hypothetical protein